MADGKNGLGSELTLDSTPESVKLEADNLARGLIRILEKHDVTINTHPDELKELLVDLSIFMVNRDHQILEHGMSLGARRAGPKYPEVGYAITILKQWVEAGQNIIDYRSKSDVWPDLDAMIAKSKDYIDNV